MNFYDLLAAQTNNFPEKTFLTVDQLSLTYENFLQALEKPFPTSKFLSQALNFFRQQKNCPKNTFQVHSGGSTANSKTFLRSFESWNDFFPIQNKIFRLNHNSILFMHGDLNFTGNLNSLLAILHSGGSIITTDKFSPKIWLQLINSATNIYLVPSKLNLIAHGMPIRHIKSIFTGSQVLSASQSLNLLKKFPCADIFLYYGASELSFVSYKKISPENAADTQNLGKPFPKINIFIREDKIFVETPFRAENIPNPATVGDFGRIEDGNLIFLGRGDDFINKGGVKLSALALEQKISQIPGVEAVSVVKIHDNLRGDHFLAYIVGKIEKKIVRQALLPAELPKDIIFLDSLPLNAAGKVDKRFLAKL